MTPRGRTVETLLLALLWGVLGWVTHAAVFGWQLRELFRQAADLESAIDVLRQVCGI